MQYIFFQFQQHDSLNIIRSYFNLGLIQIWNLELRQIQGHDCSIFKASAIYRKFFKIHFKTGGYD